MAAPSKLEHVADIGRAGRVSEHRLLEFIGSKAVTDRESKDVDHVIRMRTDEMGAENAAAAFFDECLETVDRLGNAAGCYTNPVRSRA